MLHAAGRTEFPGSEVNTIRCKQDQSACAIAQQGSSTSLVECHVLRFKANDRVSGPLTCFGFREDWSGASKSKPGDKKRKQDNCEQ